MSSNKFPFTRNRVRDLPIPKNGRLTYHDEHTTGLQIRVSQSGSKIFSYYGKIAGKNKRINIGAFADGISVKHAQTMASQFKLMLQVGNDPHLAKKVAKNNSLTLLKCLESYLETRNTLSPATISKYRNEPNRHLKSWLNKPMKNISEDDIIKMHKAITKKSPSVANRIMRLVRALFNHSNLTCKDINGNRLFPDNPVKCLSLLRLWNNIESRTGYLKVHELEKWIQATEELARSTRYGEVQRDFLQLALFTGLRRNEALKLEWENIDFKNKTLLVPLTKNGKSHSLPLCTYTYALLKRRHKTKKSKYVFAACSGNGHLVEPQHAIVKVRELSGVHFTPHDLRRTFITIAESLDISHYSIKRLVNHSFGRDVTATYVIWNIERIREPIQRVSDFICKAAGLRETTIIKISKLNSI